MALAGIVVIEGWRAWRAWTERSVSVWSHERGLVRQGGSHLEKAVEEGDVVGPFLQGGVEQSKGSVDARGILAEALVLGRRVFCVHGIAGQPGPSSIGSTVHALPPPLRPGLPWPNWFLHCLGTGDSRPELSGDIERRPGSSAMVGGQIGRDEGPRGGRVAAAHCWCWAASVSGGGAGLASSKNRGRVRLKSSSRVRGRAWGYRVLFCSAAWLHLELKLIGVVDSTPTDAQAQAGTRCSRPCNEGEQKGCSGVA